MFKLIGDASPHRLTRDPAKEHSPAWSPDGRWIAFVRIEKKSYRVCLISPLGGPEVELAQARHSVSPAVLCPGKASLGRQTASG